MDPAKEKERDIKRGSRQTVSQKNEAHESFNGKIIKNKKKKRRVVYTHRQDGKKIIIKEEVEA